MEALATHTVTPTADRAPRTARHAPAYPGALRVTGGLTEDARLYPTTAQAGAPGLLLWLALQPADGLPYSARVHLGHDLADHMAAEALLPHLRRSAVISLAAEAMHLATEHGHPVLRLAHPHSVVLLQNPLLQPAAPVAPVATDLAPTPEA